MRWLDHREPMPEALRGAIIALGNFDGFHRGHQAVAGAAIDWARAEGRPAIIATFDPHPVRFFAPDAAPFRLTTLDQRQELFAAAGADAMLVFAFDAELAATTADSFVRDLLVGRLGENSLQIITQLAWPQKIKSELFGSLQQLTRHADHLFGVAGSVFCGHGDTSRL